MLLRNIRCGNAKRTRKTGGFRTVQLQRKFHYWLEEPRRGNIAYWINSVIYLLIILSVLSLMLSTVDTLHASYADYFELTNHVTMLIFTVEYLARVYAAGAEEAYKGIRGKLRYMLTPYAIIDLVSILPYLLTSLDINSVFMRTLRLLRILRLFRMRKYAIFAQILKKIVVSKKEEFLVLLFYSVIMLVLLSFLIFELEHDTQPEVFSNVVQTLWWAVATLTTVGYGDMYPVTGMGQFITAIISVLGIAFVAIPGGIFASEFISEFSKRTEDGDEDYACCRCGSREITIFHGTEVHKDGMLLKHGTLQQCDECGFCWLGPTASADN